MSGRQKQKNYNNRKELIFIETDYIDTIAERLSEKIEKKYANYGVEIRLKFRDFRSDRFIFEVKLKGSTRESQIFDRAPDVQLRLKLPIFRPFKDNNTIYIATSDQKIVYDHLPKLLSSSQYAETKRRMGLPHIVGYNVMGEVVIADLSNYPHLLLGGSTNSGKTIGLKALILSIVSGKSPNKVNLILIDVGANDLMPFDGIPHLSCPVIRDGETAIRALLALKKEMEHRIEFRITDNLQFKSLPRIVLVVDEFPALIVGLGKKSKFLTDTISSLLQRGRHAKIHVVLAAQNPTLQNMKIDLGNITARMAFTCAKPNFSMTILGESGAEKLSGNGDMYFKSPQHDGLQRIQGAYINHTGLVLQLHIKMKQHSQSTSAYKFTISETDLHEPEDSLDVDLIGRAVAAKWDADDMFFVDIIVWALKQKSISCNMICDTFHIGWKRANEFLDRLYNLEIVGDIYAKLPRTILPVQAEDLSLEAIAFLERHGYSWEEISDIFVKTQ